MSALGAIRRSNLARLGTFALIILFYVVYVLGSLLEFGFGQPGIDPITRRVGGASVALIVALLVLRWFVETNVESGKR